MGSKTPRRRVVYDRGWLSILRYEKGITQKGLAEVVGISHSMYYKVESGRSMPNPITCLRIADALDFDVNLWRRDRRTQITSGGKA